MPRLMVDRFGLRAMLLSPLLSGGEAIGALGLHRVKPEPFTPSQIDLVQSFAAQAVIAIENVRQFRAIQAANVELEARLEREAATRQIIEVINHSREDENPVFDAILERAARLCNATMAGLLLVTDDRRQIGYVRQWGVNRKAFEEGETWDLDGPLLIGTAVR